MATTTTNQQFTISWKDLARGLLMAVIGAVLAFLQTSFASGEVVFNWPAIGNVAVITAIGYLIKNFFTPSEIVIVNPAKNDLNAVKSGNADVKVS